MPYVTSALSNGVDAASFSCETRDDALLKAVELAKGGAESVSVTDIESGEVLTGDELLAAVEALVPAGTPPD